MRKKNGPGGEYPDQKLIFKLEGQEKQAGVLLSNIRSDQEHPDKYEWIPAHADKFVLLEFINSHSYSKQHYEHAITDLQEDVLQENLDQEMDGGVFFLLHYD